LLAAWLFAGGGARVLAGEPREELEGSISRVLEVLRDPALKGEEHRATRRKKLREIIYARFDLAEMGKRSLARQWRKRSPEEKKEFVDVFSELLEGSYVSKIEAWTNEKIVYLTERKEEKYAEVKSRIVSESGRDIAIDYRLHKTPEGWRVYDVIIEGVSLVANYRRQFKRLIRKSSYKDLLARMKAKQGEFNGTGKGKKL
jgi:phospholipid transport system substrate-binding protein